MTIPSTRALARAAARATLLVTCSLALTLGAVGCDSNSGDGGGDGGGDTGGGDTTGGGGTGGGDTGGGGTTGGSTWDADLVINEVAAAGDPADWIEILNRGDEAVDLTGCALGDDDPAHVWTFADGASIAAGAHLLVLRDEPGSFTFGFGSTDSAFLYDPAGEVLDFVHWVDGASPTGWSWGRIPDGTGSFQTLAYPTPGAANEANPSTECGNGTLDHDEVCDGDKIGDTTCEDLGLSTGTPGCAGDCQSFTVADCEPPTRDITINEVRSSGDDAIELTNPGDAPVDISGWTLHDQSAVDLDAYVFGAGTVIAPDQYLVLVKGLDHLFGVGNKDGIRLRDDDGVLIDTTDWGKDDADVSWCRIPDGLGDFQRCSNPTFGDPNQP